jgi:hypothetical protein
MHRTPALVLRHLIGLVVGVLTAVSASGAPSLLDNMDGARPVLQLLPSGASAQKVLQEIDRRYYRCGTGSERLVLNIPPGRSAHLGFRMPASRVVHELSLAARVFCSQPGAQLGAEVELPRSVDPSTGTPFRMLLRIGVPCRGGLWEDLRFDNLSEALERQVRVARAGNSFPIDQRGAHILSVVLIVPGGRTPVQLWVDRIRVDAAVAVAGENQADVAEDPRIPTQVADVRFPRIIQWQGEPLEKLASLGFNTVAFSRPPKAKELTEARRVGIRVVCPPPTPGELAAQGIDASSAPVLAWDMGRYSSESDLTGILNHRDILRQYDPQLDRPVVMTSGLSPMRASRAAETVLLDRPVVGSGLSFREIGSWLFAQKRLCRPGTDVWAAIETQPPERLTAQAKLFGARAGAGQTIAYGRLTSLCSSALAARAVGLCFASDSPLFVDDPASKQRENSLELCNMRLAMAEAWLADGRPLSSAESNIDGLSAAVLCTERSHLLVPVYWSDGIDVRRVGFPRRAVSFIVPGVPDSSDAYLLSPASMERLDHKRVTGGLRISLEGLPPDAMLLLTDDAKVISRMSAHVRKNAQRAAQLRRSLVELRLASDIVVNGALRSVGVELEEPDPLLEMGPVAAGLRQATRRSRPVGRGLRARLPGRGATGFV